jgi:hypothetical protein
MSEPSDLEVRLLKMATCVYLAAEKGPADDLSDGLTKAAAEIKRLRERVETLQNFLKVIRASANLALSEAASLESDEEENDQT